MTLSSSRVIKLNEPEQCFWESEVYQKSYFKNLKSKGFSYYDNYKAFKFLFFSWVGRWVGLLSRQYLEPYKLHPLPLSDQIVYLQPIFSKHVSDGLARLEAYEAAKPKSREGRAKRPYKSILWRALYLTVRNRAFSLLVGSVILNILTMSVTTLVKLFLVCLKEETINLVATFLLLVALVVSQMAEGLFIEIFNFHTNRLICIVEYLISIATFQHAMSHRRNFYNNINGSNSLNVCNQVVHSCSPGTECAKNPLYCQARRHQNKDINPQIFTFESMDTHYIAMGFESFKYFCEFLVNLCYGSFLLSIHAKVDIWVLYLVGIVFTFAMIVVEVLGAATLKFVLYLRDYKMTKCNNIFLHLALIKKMLYDDIAVSIITQARNNEISALVINFFVSHLNSSLYIFCMSSTFYLIQRYFVKSVNAASVITDIDTAGFMTTFTIFFKMAKSMFLIPASIKVIARSYVSFKRVSQYVNECSPNFYTTDNRFTGSTSVSSTITDITNQLPNDVVVYYKDATFTWVNSRNDLLNKNYEPYLRNINFELKRGEIAIVTGSQGSGKSNFIKSMLGEMTLVGGSMAVVPLHTSMPIFYASQDIWLQQGTIRSNIVFGYKFDEQLYNTVLKAVELEFDISTWDKGDLRVVSDNAHTLSGGQRVRMELARAVYAYLVFHKVNKEYNNSKCSFLVCLDASFHGLDPYVSKTIFNNLFNLKTGLLSMDDLSVVLTASKRSLDISTKTSDLTQIPNAPIYKIKNQKLQFHSNLYDFVKNNKVVSEDYKYLSASSSGPYHMSYLTNDMLRLCSSDATTRLGRKEVITSLYSASSKMYVKDNLSGGNLNPFKVYMKPALTIFVIYMLMDITAIILDTLKYVYATRYSDYILNAINNHMNGMEVDLSEVKSKSNFALNLTLMFVSSTMVLSFVAMLAMLIGSLVSSRKIHEYVISSVFTHKSSSMVIKDLYHIMTYLSCDMMLMDDNMGWSMYLLLTAFMNLLIKMVTLFYTIPLSAPVVVVALLILVSVVLNRYTNSVRLMLYGYFETCLHVNSVLEEAISGSSVARSFNKDSEFQDRFIEHRDYKARYKFMVPAIGTWAIVIFNWVLSSAALTVFTLATLLHRYTNYKMTVGYFGLALSLFTNMINSFGYFSFIYASLEMVLVTVYRFRYFIPDGKKLTFGKFVNAHEEYVVNLGNKAAIAINKRKLFRRRAAEFKADSKKFYCIKRLFYHPKIAFMDVEPHLTPDHSGVDLKDVCVYTTPDHNPDGMILKHLSVSAHKSEIIGMVGRTGSGKTTLLSILLNTSTNRTGQVLLDGKDLNNIPKVILRQIVGVLPQLPFVFEGWTVRRFLDPRKLFSDDEINNALTQCGLTEFIDTLPGRKRLDTVMVPEDEDLLNPDPKSGNQLRRRSSYRPRILSRQLNIAGYETEMLLSSSQLRTLSLARLVLYRHFYRMIVVDEPPEEDVNEEASARKDDLEVPIYELLQKHFSHCTTFVASDDVNTLKKCTSVWVMHDGSLVKTCKASDVSASDSISTIIEKALENKP